MISRRNFLRGAALLAATSMLLTPATPALAGICFTSGRVYVQQKNWPKACYNLECARREEPGEVKIYNLLAFARSEQYQYMSSGGALELGFRLAQRDEKKHKKEIDQLVITRRAVNVDLFNRGLKALNNAGNPSFQESRTQGDESTPQGRIEKAYGAPPYYSIVIEAGGSHEFWYYPEKGKSFHFPPGSAEPEDDPFVPYVGFGDPEKAVVDTTVYGPYQGGSYFEEAAYWFRLASYVDPQSIDTYLNLSYVLNAIGRADDSMRAARLGLAIDPKNDRLQKNLRAAAMSTGNRFYGAGEYPRAIKAYNAAMQVDTASTIAYMERIANSWYNLAQSFEKGAEKTAAYDSAAASYQRLLDVVPADTVRANVTVRENALYNASVIYNNLEQYAKAAEILEKAVELFPNNKEMASLLGQMRFLANDYAGALPHLKRAIELDPADAVSHQYLFNSLMKLAKTKEAEDEYWMYRSLNDGTPKRANLIKIWCDTADNRYGKENDLNAVRAAEQYPEEIRTFSDENNKTVETWFYWSKGKAFSFREGKKVGQGTFPPKKES
jgi:tetratricopeptide (TPR) repeat protein